VTSDSIAARVASAVGACELVLMKSAPPDIPVTCEGQAQSARVDPYFPLASRGLLIRYVNLRNPEAVEVSIE
jgi:hypothetical protein